MNNINVAYFASPNPKQDFAVMPQIKDWITYLESEGFSVTVVEQGEATISPLHLIKYNIVLLDIGTSNVAALENLVSFDDSNIPQPILIAIVDPDQLSAEFAPTIQYVDDVILSNVSVELFKYRFEKILKWQQSQNNVLKRTKLLHAVSVISQKLHHIDHPKTLIVDMMQSICLHLNAYGVAFTLYNEQDDYALFAGQRHKNEQKIYESQSFTHDFDPLVYVINTDTSLICNDIKRHPHYSPIPILENPQSALILPLRVDNSVIGSLSIFSDDDHFTNDDLVAYEILATHFARAYNNIRNYHTQMSDIFSTKQTLHAWQELTSTYTIEEVADKLQDLLQEVDSVDRSVIWLFKQDTSTKTLVISPENETISQILNQMLENAELDSLMSEFDIKMRSATFHKHHVGQSSFTDLMDELSANSLVLVPIADTTLHGGIFVLPEDEKVLSTTNLHRVEGLAYAAGHSLERSMIISSLREQHSRLDAVLSSMREAIFFVNNEGILTYCNPQFTELTAILRSQIIGKPYDILLHLLGEKTESKNDLIQQLQVTIQQLSSQTDDVVKELPIIQFVHAEMNTNLYIQFLQTSSDTPQKGWIGLVSASEQVKTKANKDQLLFNNILTETVTNKLIDIQNDILKLPQQHDMLSSHGYNQQLQLLQGQATGVLHTWNNFVEIRNGLPTEFDLNLAVRNITEFIEDMISSGLIHIHHKQIKLLSQPPSPSVPIDEHRIKLMIINFIDFFTYYLGSTNPLIINVVSEYPYALISFQERNASLPDTVLENIYNLDVPARDNQERSIRAGMMLNKEIVAVHGGNILYKNSLGWGVMATVQIPIVEFDKSDPEQQLTTFSVRRTTEYANLAIIVIESTKKILSAYYSDFNEEGYQLLIEQSVNDLLINISLVSADMIFLEANPYDNRLIETCRKIRNKTDLPIMIVADPSLKDTCIEALSVGADGYFLLPLTRDDLLGHLNSIKQRKYIATRTAPPIKVGDLFIDLSRRRVFLKDDLLDLTTKEYKLLEVLASHPNQALTHQQLLSKVWGPEYRDEKQYLWVNISRLRRKLEPENDSPRYIHTEQGVGYCLREP